MTFNQAQLALQKYFGYDKFYPTQKKAIKSVLAGQDTFVLMPTGGGKSICYQIPALILEGTTIVVSPLIALMKDQVDGLKANGIAAEFLNSSLDPAAQSKITKKLLKGEIKLLYVSAERLVSAQFIKILKQIKLNLFAIDEAHCISTWGHDFRPNYTQLSHLKTQFKNVPIIALTATADHSTRADILVQLELDNPEQLVDSFDRPNISLTVLPGKKRLEQIRKFLSDKTNQSGIVYCLTRKRTENLAQKLQQSGINAASYHAGLSKAERSRIQQSFVRDKTQVICATIAFGMGIDKSNVRWIIHYNLPKNIESYYQEIGRAGRDSAPAQALLFYTYKDVETLKKFTISSKQKALQLSKLDRIKEYAEGVICRRQILLQYFGEAYNKQCNNCDICASPFDTFDGTAIAKKILTTIQKANKKSHPEATISQSPAVTTKNLVSILTRSSNKVSFASWHFYIAQLKNLGLIKINFSKNQYLFVTKKGKAVLSGSEFLKNSTRTSSKQMVVKKIKLVTLNTFIEKQETLNKKITTKKTTPKTTHARKKTKNKPKKDYYKNPLFEKLRQTRLKIAQSKNIAAYMVFSDKTLLQMAHEKPKNKKEMLAISGVGEIKWQRYGEAFLHRCKGIN